MATAKDVESFVTCIVCFYVYDDFERKPKFLPCSHTVCLSCLKEISKGHLITCPFCREMILSLDVSTLPNNPYALHMLKFKEKKASNSTANHLEISWCLTCESVEKRECSTSGHSSVNITTRTIKNLDNLLKLKEELLAMKDTGTNKLAMAIEERKKVQEHLSLISKAVQCSAEEVEKLQDENNLRLVESISALESNGSKANSHVGQSKKKLFFSELMTLVEGSSVDDTTETLKLKMGKSIELSEQNLSVSASAASKYEFRKKVKIAIHLYDDNDRPIPTVAWLEEGFRFPSALEGSQIRQDSILLSHAVFSLLHRQKIDLNVQSTAISMPLKPDARMKTIAKELPDREKVDFKLTSLSLPPSDNKKFVLGHLSVFIVRFFQSGSLKGEFFIRPVPTYHMNFVQKLGEFTYNCQKVFCNNVDQASPGIFVRIPMGHSQFEPVVPNMIDCGDVRSHDNPKAEELNDVGITNLIQDVKHAIFGWSFVFPLEHFRDPRNEVLVKKCHPTSYSVVL